METENYYKMDPDPFDERHPSRADPDCQLGLMLKVLFRKDVFMTKVTNIIDLPNSKSINKQILLSQFEER